MTSVEVEGSQPNWGASLSGKLHSRLPFPDAFDGGFRGYYSRSGEREQTSGTKGKNKREEGSIRGTPYIVSSCFSMLPAFFAYIYLIMSQLANDQSLHLFFNALHFLYICRIIFCHRTCIDTNVHA